MSTVNVVATYSDGDVLFEADLDDLKSRLETFFNTTGLGSTNFNTNTITSSKLHPDFVDDTVLELNIDNQVTIKGSSITVNLLAPDAKHLPIGCIEMFQSFAGSLDIPSNWKICDGTAISDLESPLNGYYTPDMSGALAKGSTTTSTGLTTISKNGADTVSTLHNHKIYDYSVVSSPGKLLYTGASRDLILRTGLDSSLKYTIQGTANSSSCLGVDMYTSNTNVTASTIPNNITALFCMRIK